MFTIDRKTADLIHPDLFNEVCKMFPKGLKENQTNEKTLKYPGQLHIVKEDINVTICIKNGKSVADKKGLLVYCWDRLIFRTCQMVYAGDPETLEDYQHLFALSLLCICICLWSKTEKRRSIAEGVLYYIDLLLYNHLNLPAFSIIRFLPPEQIMDVFNKYNRTMMELYGHTRCHK